MVVGGEDHNVRMIDSQTWSQAAVLRGHAASVSDMCFMGNHRLCSYSRDGSVIIWDLSSFQMVSRVQLTALSRFTDPESGFQFSISNAIVEVVSQREQLEGRLYRFPRNAFYSTIPRFTVEMAVGENAVEVRDWQRGGNVVFRSTSHGADAGELLTGRFGRCSRFC